MEQTQATIRNDSPTIQDALSVEPYTNALAKFISDCETPMTIAIQGDWGSGKTSLMRMVKELLANKPCRVIDFNTWQYAQFQMGDDLVLALMEHLIESVGKDVHADSHKVQLLRAGLREALFSLAGTFGNMALDEAGKMIPFGGIAINAARGAAQAGKAGFQSAASDSQFNSSFRGQTSAIETLRDTLQSYISGALESGEDERIVVMIDDLDRLPPQRAVEVMEAIKVFLDVDKCVYVLAIDFDVVKEGVRHKFGSQFDDRKAFAFFDKIIQVPFHMPVAAYNVDKFLLKMLFPEEGNRSSSRSQQKESEEEGEHYIALAKQSVGNNPRSLKRLANTFHLLRGLEDSNESATTTPKLSVSNLRLFATLCMQSAMPAYYREFQEYVLQALDFDSEGTQSLLSDFFESQIQGFRSDSRILSIDENGSVDFDEHKEFSQARKSLMHSGVLGERYGLSAADASRFSTFLDSFRQVFSADNNSDDEIDTSALEHALVRATVTSVGSGSKAVEHQGSLVYGWDNVESGLKKADTVQQEPIEIIARIVKKLESELPDGQFDVGLSSDRKRVILYVDKENHARGTMSEIHVGLRTISIRFGARYLPQESVETWREEAGRVFKVSKNKTPTFQINLLSIKKLSDVQLDALARWLVEAQARTRKHFFPIKSDG